METKILEVVSYVASFLYGTLARSRVDLFAEQLANLLIKNENKTIRDVIVVAARDVRLDEETILQLLPAEIHFERYSPSAKNCVPLQVSYDSGRPYFSIISFLPIWTACDFSATRFGSTKLKTYPNGITGRVLTHLQHPYTSPSSYAYLQLLIYLNLIVLGQILHEQTAMIQ